MFSTEFIVLLGPFYRQIVTYTTEKMMVDNSMGQTSWKNLLSE